MNEILGIAVLCLVGIPLFTVLLSLVGFRIRRWIEKEEAGPWVVSRVGVGGREFWTGSTVPALQWTEEPRWSKRFATTAGADQVAETVLGDVHPLSKFTGVRK